MVPGPMVDDEGLLMMEVNASIPEATDYKHIHFGVWAALGDPEKNGTQELCRSRHRLRPELLGRGVDADRRR